MICNLYYHISLFETIITESDSQKVQFSCEHFVEGVAAISRLNVSLLLIE